MTDVESNPGRDEHQEQLARGSTAELLSRAGSISREEDRIRDERRELHADIQSKWQSMKETDPDADQSDRLREVLKLISARDQGGTIDHIDGVIERFERLKPGIPVLYSQEGVSFKAAVIDNGMPNLVIDRKNYFAQVVVPVVKPGYFSAGGVASSAEIAIEVGDGFDDVVIGKDAIEYSLEDMKEKLSGDYAGIGTLWFSSRLNISVVALQSVSDQFPELKDFRGLDELQALIKKKSTSKAMGRRVHRSERPSRRGKWTI